MSKELTDAEKLEAVRETIRTLNGNPYAVLSSIESIVKPPRAPQVGDTVRSLVNGRTVEVKDVLDNGATLRITDELSAIGILTYANRWEVVE